MLLGIRPLSFPLWKALVSHVNLVTVYFELFTIFKKSDTRYYKQCLERYKQALCLMLNFPKAVNIKTIFIVFLQDVITMEIYMFI